jgi:hypothetical protein
MAFATIKNRIYRWISRRYFSGVDSLYALKRPYPEERYIELWNSVKQSEYEVVRRFEAETTFSIDRIWLDKLALLTQISIKPTELCYAHGRVLYAAVAAYVAKNRDHLISMNIVETGTSRGFSALCMAKALADLNVCGKIVTVDVVSHHTKRYWNCLLDENGKITRSESLAPYHDLASRYVIFLQNDSLLQLERLSVGRVHFAFLDSSHEYQDVLGEAICISREQRHGDVILFDDYSTKKFPGLVEAVDIFCNDYGYDKRIIDATGDRLYVLATKR